MVCNDWLRLRITLELGIFIIKLANLHIHEFVINCCIFHVSYAINKQVLSIQFNMNTIARFYLLYNSRNMFKTLQLCVFKYSTFYKERTFLTFILSKRDVIHVYTQAIVRILPGWCISLNVGILCLKYFMFTPDTVALWISVGVHVQGLSPRFS